MRIIVCGGRTYNDSQLVEAVIYSLPRDAVIVDGGARGADTLANESARRLGRAFHRFHAQWTRYGKAAGKIRNQDMLDAGADYVVAFEGGSGTAHMMGIARAAGITVWQPDIEDAPAGFICGH